MPQKKNKDSMKAIEELLDQQTLTILSAVDEKLKKSEKRVGSRIRTPISLARAFFCIFKTRGVSDVITS